MKITIANWDARPQTFDAQAAALAIHVAANGSDLVLLPEMPFTPWLSLSADPVQADWDTSIAIHEEQIARLATLTGSAIAGSRPVVNEGKNHNQAFLWDDAGFADVTHQKRALPAEDGYWEAHWYAPGKQAARPVDYRGFRFGFAICTELWDSPHTGRLSRAGADVILAPRATPDFGDDVWVAGVRALAVQTGCYVLSSNFAYPLAVDFTFEGLSAAADPDGVLIGLTTPDAPFATIDIDVDAAQVAKTTYPRYIFVNQ